MSGSTCSRPAERRSSSSSGATAIGRMLLRAHDLDAGERVLGGDRPSRSTRGSGPVRSSTVDGVPGARRRRARPPPPGAPPARPRGAAGRSTVEVRARRRHCSHLASSMRPEPASSGTRTPIVSGRSPVSHGYRQAGSGRRACTARAAAPARPRRSPRSSGTHPSRTSTLAARRARSAARATVSWPPTAPAPGPPRYGEQARPYTVSVGITTSPRPGARRRRRDGGHGEALGSPLAPGQVVRDDDVLVPELAQEAGDAAGVPVRDLEHEAPRGEHGEGAAGDRLRRALGDERDARLPVAHLAWEPVQVAGADVRRIRDDEAPRPFGEASKRSHSASSTGTPVLPLPRATSSASFDASIPVTSAPGCSSAIRARSPRCPCRRRARGVPRRPRSARGTARRRSPSRTRHEDARVDVEEEAPEAPLAEHVGERLARLAARRARPAASHRPTGGGARRRQRRGGSSPVHARGGARRRPRRVLASGERSTRPSAARTLSLTRKRPREPAGVPRPGAHP